MPVLPTKTATPVLVPLAVRIEALNGLMGMVQPIPAEWLGGAAATVKQPKAGLACTPCNNYNTLVQAWRKALKWTDGLDCALSVMLASVTSTMQVGDQLWVKIIGPASCGKSTLCEALSVNDKYILAKSTIRGFHSGYKSDRDGTEDNSLIVQVRNKTLITKDGDTILQSPNLGQILSDARDLYDCTTRSHYKNKMGKDYVGVRMTWILCGTSSLRSIDSSELGERFVDCVVMEGIDDDLEDEILWRVANRADRNMAVLANGDVTTNYEPELALAMGLTGGYVDWLRENASQLLAQVQMNETHLRLCTRLGKFVAYMRARPSKQQDENSEREFAARLVSQHTRLAKCLAVVLNRPVDDEVMRRTTKVALDTARGQTYKIADHLYRAVGGLETRALALYTNNTEDKTRTLLRFLRQIGVVELGEASTTGMSKQPKWVLTARLRALFSEIEG